MIKARSFLSLILAMLCLIHFSGCGERPLAVPKLSGLNSIAELSTLRCYYHNVAEVRNDGEKLLFDLVVVGYKKAWFEYSGYVDVGVDMTKVEVDAPDSNNVVKVKMPAVEIFGLNIDEDTLQMRSYEGGLFQKVTFEEITGARDAAEQKMKEQIESDTPLFAQAKVHAEELIESYIVSVGASRGQTFTVEFVDADK